MSLHQQFLQIIKQMNVQTVYAPIFYQAKYALRFEMGVGRPIDEKDQFIFSYFQNARQRARELFQALGPFDILRIDLRVGTINDKLFTQYVESIGLSSETQLITYKDDGYKYLIKAYYWYLPDFNLDVEKLFEDILYTDFRKPHFLAGNVYFLNSQAKLLYHLYDDRGLDLVATNKATLKPIYQQYHQWLLDYDRKAMQEIFEK
ncbi:DUF3885 domain-containing protein [Enterococcus columbae]|uniref:DUF3885 domain-containing protein n=1 Tax=Enterococcus columbae DSM 7374 = ATCC 51263 TaxID=1121865 RepID=S0KII5_9ENTE|nr:DUF3885 domain-containing protein [Enterococcus columbae]EOT44649.1 hypothetical protein OMW_00705 [Enterococcus columbae DSM 7374 = ATCC 51263]EOW87455.1 hypothetical protein I568_00499 [Enterococcus columbae DSM 7374 = ATCC 51263]OJG25112.1 hypothetical protein RR47_GL001900 [Enterococcus columbae DSM 7374 = ATCC 51263]